MSGRLCSEIGKHKIVTILLAALLTVVALMFLLRIPDRLHASPKQVTVEESGGFYDLSGIENLNTILVTLPPGDKFYPNALLTPGNMGGGLPESTERYGELRAQYLTQRFAIEVPDDQSAYVLAFRLSGRHALRAYVNGELAGQIGSPDTTKENTEIGENNLTVYVAPVNGRIEVILNSAQFYHYKRGASLATLTVHKAIPGFETGFAARERGYLVIGALGCAAVLMLCIFSLQPVVKSTLYFALACLVMMLRECLQSQAWTDFSFIPGNLSFMLEYLSVVLLTVFLTLCLGWGLKGKVWNLLKFVIYTASGIYALCLLFGDSVFYTSILKYYQVTLVISIVCGVAGLFRVMRHPTVEQAAALYGLTVFYMAAVSDILMYNDAFAPVLSKVPLSETAMLIFVVAQSFSLFLTNIRLMDEAREGERRLAGEKEVLERLNLMKTEFLGNISHELKTPLTVVSGNIQYVRNNLHAAAGTEETERAMKLIDGETARMGLMVSQLLDVSRIDEGRMTIEKRKESLVEIIQSTLDDYYPYFSKNHNRLTFKREGDIPPVWCDRNRIIQVLVNLITNAARHTRQGEIAVSVKAVQGETVITVADTGEGIEPERLSHLFERYYTRRSSDEKARAGWDTGTGLGLYICRYIVEAHGGGIAVESAPGLGTTVMVSLPLREAGEE